VAMTTEGSWIVALRCSVEGKNVRCGNMALKTWVERCGSHWGSTTLNRWCSVIPAFAGFQHTRPLGNKQTGFKYDSTRAWGCRRIFGKLDSHCQNDPLVDT
jgi:hypothetical protein